MKSLEERWEEASRVATKAASEKHLREVAAEAREEALREAAEALRSAFLGCLEEQATNIILSLIDKEPTARQTADAAFRRMNPHVKPEELEHYSAPPEEPEPTMYIPPGSTIEHLDCGTKSYPMRGGPQSVKPGMYYATIENGEGVLRPIAPPEEGEEQEPPWCWCSHNPGRENPHTHSPEWGCAMLPKPRLRSTRDEEIEVERAEAKAEGFEAGVRAAAEAALAEADACVNRGNYAVLRCFAHDLPERLLSPSPEERMEVLVGFAPHDSSITVQGMTLHRTSETRTIDGKEFRVYREKGEGE